MGRGTCAYLEAKGHSKCSSASGVVVVITIAFLFVLKQTQTLQNMDDTVTEQGNSFASLELAREMRDYVFLLLNKAKQEGRDTYH